jgi:CBS domain-containing protein
MKDPLLERGGCSMTLKARTAAGLMTPNLVSVRENATVKEAAAFLIDKGISGVPVIDEAGRPVGVLSQTDVLIHERERVEYLPVGPTVREEYEAGAPVAGPRWEGFQIEQTDPTPVSAVMTPVVFTVEASAPATRVIREMLTLNVHRLFVVDDNNVLIGVISTLDVRRHLQFRPE